MARKKSWAEVKGKPRIPEPGDLVLDALEGVNVLESMNVGTRVPEVREVDGARALITIDGTDKVWSEAWEDSRVVADTMTYFKGAIVRVQPPADATDERVEAVQALLVNAGAEVVRVAPRRKASVLPPAAREAVAHESARQVVGELVGAAHVEDREALRAFVDGVMARQGIR